MNEVDKNDLKEGKDVEKEDDEETGTDKEGEHEIIPERFDR